MIEKLYDRQEVAEAFNRCPHWVMRQEKKGLLPRVQLTDRTIRYKETDINKLIDKLTVGGGAL